MLKKAKRFLMSIIVTNIKFIFIKIFHPSKFFFSFYNFITPFITIDIQGKGKIIIRKKVNIPYKTILGVREDGILNIKEGVFINNNCQIVAHKNISIGQNVCIGPNTVIVDHDHSFDENGVDKKHFTSKDIVIGNNVWIGANCVILKGTRIEDNCVIGAGTIVKGTINKGSKIIQKRIEE